MLVMRPLSCSAPFDTGGRPVRFKSTNKGCSQQGYFPWGKTPVRSFAGTRCMNRWDEGSWDTDPQRHGRFTIIADRGKTAFTSGMLGLPYPLQLFCTRYGRCSSPSGSILSVINFGQACNFNTFRLDKRGRRVISQAHTFRDRNQSISRNST